MWLFLSMNYCEFVLCDYSCSGEGMFGKVYTAVNMDTGAYMAMKEVSASDKHTAIVK